MRVKHADAGTAIDRKSGDSNEERGAIESDDPLAVPLSVPSGVDSGPQPVPIALAQALLTQAESAADPAPLLAAAQALINEAQRGGEAKRGTGS